MGVQVLIICVGFRNELACCLIVGGRCCRDGRWASLIF